MTPTDIEKARQEVAWAVANGLAKYPEKEPEAKPPPCKGGYRHMSKLGDFDGDRADYNRQLRIFNAENP